MPSYGIYNRLIDRTRTTEESNNAAYTEAVQQMVLGLKLLPVGVRLEETLKTGNEWNLGAGTYASFSHEESHNVIRGVVAGAKFTRSCRMGGHASVFGVEFSDDDQRSATELVRIGSGAVVSFVSCLFRRDPTSVGGMVYMEDSAPGVAASSAVFIGCTFVNGGTTTIDNVSTTAIKVQAIGCVNGTGNGRLDGTTAPAAVQITETGTVRVLNL